MEVREIFVPSSSSTTASLAAESTRTSSVSRHNCRPINLPAGGVLYIPGADPVTLAATAVYKPICLPAGAPAIVASSGAGTVAGDLSNTTSTSSLSADNLNMTNVNLDDSAESTPQYSDFRDSFYASTFPQCYALASTTVIAYTLVIMLFITPRSFLDGGVVVLGRRGFTNGGSGGKNIGGRPWLQKVAALTVAISLTIATADTFRVAGTQYSWGIQNAKEMQQEVLGGTELKVIRIISDTFLWLAQAQTLVRLFPRQREKIIIKWTAFAVITLNVIFDCLNSFLYAGTGHSFTAAIPALSYLFELALSVLYAVWVIYYSLMKKRYAFYHPRMRNICLVAALSLLAILVPIVFFVLDICKPDFTGWGDYVLWVGAAAASVIVWEWVERIEALEREEKKDGILGREVFDGDEMLDIMPSDLSWPRRRKKEGAKAVSQKSNKYSGNGSDEGGDDRRPGGDRSGITSGRTTLRIWPSMSTFTKPYRLRARSRTSQPKSAQRSAAKQTTANVLRADASGNGEAGVIDDANPALGTAVTDTPRSPQPPLWPSRPARVVTPVSRSDTTSADSTVYVMRYHPVTDSHAGSTLGVHPSTVPASLSHSNSTSTSTASSSNHGQHPRTSTSFTGSQSVHHCVLTHASPPPQDQGHSVGSDIEALGGERTASRWRSLAHALPLRRGAASAEPSHGETSDVAVGRPSKAASSSLDNGRLQHDGSGRWDIRGRLEEFAATQAERFRERIRPSLDTTGLPVMVIPAPQRQGALLARVLEEEEHGQPLQQQPQQSQRTDAPTQLHVRHVTGNSNGWHRSHSADHNSVQPSLWRSYSDSSASTMSSVSRRAPLPAPHPASSPYNAAVFDAAAASSHNASRALH
ncbi:pH-response regulator protein palH/rim21 [Sporothrix epigloea]|uniref:PH-response regulator protein palH/rim21 n=1 Tax=Sporothrix epigloea TaxID=1892477 RepID=A0ABP0D934_9PEZI